MDTTYPRYSPQVRYREAAKTAGKETVKQPEIAKERTQTQPKEKTYNKINPIAVILTLVATLALSLIVFSSMKLSEVTNKNFGLTKELTALEKEYSSLQGKMETDYNLSEVEQYAISVLGMQRPESIQVEFIDTIKPSGGEVIAKKTLWESISETLSAGSGY